MRKPYQTNILLRSSRKPTQETSRKDRGTYELSFDITPRGTVRGWANIVNFGEHSTERLPGIWFKSDSTEMYISWTTKKVQTMSSGDALLELFVLCFVQLRKGIISATMACTTSA